MYESGEFVFFSSLLLICSQKLNVDKLGLAPFFTAGQFVILFSHDGAKPAKPDSRTTCVYVCVCVRFPSGMIWVFPVDCASS